jgi:hypothetical protein
MTKSSKMVTFEALDGYTAEVHLDYIVVSVLLRGLMENMIMDSESIPLSYVPNKEYMDLLVEYLNYHAGNDDIKSLDTPIKVDKSLVKQGATEWDSDFINKLSITQLVTITNIANFMDMKALLDLCSAKLAMIIDSTSLDKLKTVFAPITNEQLE